MDSELDLALEYRIHSYPKRSRSTIVKRTSKTNFKFARRIIMSLIEDLQSTLIDLDITLRNPASILKAIVSTNDTRKAGRVNQRYRAQPSPSRLDRELLTD